MVELSALWLPILVAAVLVFIASSVIHMGPFWHRNDFPKLPDEAAARAAIGALNVPPGDYMLPRCDTMKEYGTPEFRQKLAEGPNWIITAMPKGTPSMAKSLAVWFLMCLIVGLFSGYVASHALAPGAHYSEVFRFVGTTSFMGYALGQLPQSIWYSRGWGITLKHLFDGVIYGLLTAGTFGWLWP